MTLRVHAIEAVEALSTRSNRADDDPLACCILVFQALAELPNHSDWLVSKDQTGPYGVLAPDDVDIRTADRSGGNANDSLACFGSRTRCLTKTKSISASLPELTDPCQ